MNPWLLTNNSLAEVVWLLEDVGVGQYGTGKPKDARP
jgi:hypothetical protein